jgi:hypothetical protein
MKDFERLQQECKSLGDLVEVEINNQRYIRQEENKKMKRWIELIEENHSSEHKHLRSIINIIAEKAIKP